MAAKLKTAVMGATGYSGLELTRILERHPLVERPVLLGRNGEVDGLEKSRAKNTVSDLVEIFPELAGKDEYPLQNLSWGELKAAGVELVFLATPHEVSRKVVPEAIAQGLRVIDLSGAWRLKDEGHRAVYGFEDADATMAAALTERAVYGLPELNGDCIRKARLVANPGCYATSVILALAPLLKAGLVDREHGIISDSKSGVSGAGKNASARTHFVSVADNLSAYSVFEHRHLGEIVEQLGLQDEQVTFTPHLLPIPRGILSTIYLRLNDAMAAEEVERLLREFYADRGWVRVFAARRLPEIRYSLHTNYCDLGFCLADDGRRMVMVSCLDNLMKGAAGQAVQNMNLMWGWDAREGLR